MLKKALDKPEEGLKLRLAEDTKSTPETRSKTRRTRSSEAPLFRDGLEFITYTLSLEQEVFVYKAIIEFLDQFVDPDIGEPKVLKCNGRFAKGVVEQDVILAVQQNLRNIHEERSKTLKTLLGKHK